jgi:hypothetical protein
MKNLMPIHLAAIQGRVDVIKLLLKKDHEKLIIKHLIDHNSDDHPDSPIYLSLSNSHLGCALWYFFSKR